MLEQNAAPYLPHRPPLLLIKRIMAYDDASMTTETAFDRNDFTVNDTGQVENAAMLELIAQSFAAFNGYENHQEQRPASTGFLVGIKQFKVYGAAHAGETLHVRVQRIDSFEQFHSGKGMVFRGEDCIAEAVISVWIAPDDATDTGA